MNEILGSDLAFGDDGDLVITNGDFELATGMACLNQDIHAACETFPGENIDAPYDGMLPVRQIAETDDGQQRVIRSYASMLEADPRIIPSSVKVSLSSSGDSSRFGASFETIDNQSVENMIL